MPETTLAVKPTRPEGLYRWATPEELRAYDEARQTVARMKTALMGRCRSRAAREARGAKAA
jgi:hypothetical protein